MYAMFNDVGQVVTTRCPACYSFNSKVVAWLLQPPFTTLLLGCHKVVTTKYPACYSFNSKVVLPWVQGCCMVVTTLAFLYGLASHSPRPQLFGTNLAGHYRACTLQLVCQSCTVRAARILRTVYLQDV